MAAATYTSCYSGTPLLTACLQGQLWQLLHTQAVTPGAPYDSMFAMELWQLLHTQGVTPGAPYDSMFARDIMVGATYTSCYSGTPLMTACLQGQLWQLLHTQAFTPGRVL